MKLIVHSNETWNSHVSILRYQLILHSMQLYISYKLGYLQEGITHQMNCLLNSTGNFHINRM